MYPILLALLDRFVLRYREVYPLSASADYCIGFQPNHTRPNHESTCATLDSLLVSCATASPLQVLNSGRVPWAEKCGFMSPKRWLYVFKC